MATETTKVNGVSRLAAIDIGGSLIKIAYFSGDGHSFSYVDERLNSLTQGNRCPASGETLHRIFQDRGLAFRTFENGKIDDCFEFLSSILPQTGAGKELNSSEKIVIKATGGGAFKFANLFMEKLGISLEQVDEVDSLVAGADFALKAWHREAFTYMNGEKEYILLDPQNLYPYLLVNIGTGVSITKVDSENTSQLVSGSSIGGGTFVGLGKLLTKCKSFNELLEQSHQGNTRAIDMLVEDIYGELEYSKLRFPRNALACSFGQAIHQNKELEDYRSEDIALSLLRMISYNIAQLAFMNAVLYGVKRIFFGGSFIHSNEYAMVKISEGIHDWSGGEAKATFLSHEGVLGALGAFLLSCYDRQGVDEKMGYFPES